MLLVLGACQSVPIPAQVQQLSIIEAVEIAHGAGFACTGQLLSAVAIAVAESSLRTGATNDHSEYGPRDNGSVHHDRGVWQVSSYWWPEYSDEDMADPRKSARAAYEISQGGTDFSPWDSWDNGNAQRHFDEAFDGWPALRPVIMEFCLG